MVSTQFLSLNSKIILKEQLSRAVANSISKTQHTRATQILVIFEIVRTYISFHSAITWAHLLFDYIVVAGN